MGVALLNAETVDGAIASVHHAKLFASLSEGQINRNATLAKTSPSQNLSCKSKKTIDQEEEEEGNVGVEGRYLGMCNSQPSSPTKLTLRART